VSTREPVFPLILRRRLIGLAFGTTHSARRGLGADVAGSRPYRPGDDVHSIDWAASARLSGARDADEFVVREKFADEAPRVVIVCDRRPAMALYPDGLPWLSKPEAMRVAGSLIADSTIRTRGAIGYLDFAQGDPEPFWRPPTAKSELWRVKESHLAWPQFDAPDDNLTLALEHLRRLRGVLPPGSFVFVLSDFLVLPPDDVWLSASERRWDVVPVVIQDPTWEASFPDLASVVVPFADAATGKVRRLRLSAREARERRLRNERRHDEILGGFRALGMEPVVLGSADVEDVLTAFLGWADQRLAERRGGW
jgi:uncharacterized protein (DUF58 family)